MTTSTNIKVPYVYISIGGHGGVISSSMVDTTKKIIEFDLEEDFTNKNIILYLPDIEYKPYNPNIGNVDFPNLKW
jgi:hypothetical protein